MKIAVDAMGGDFAPLEIVLGSILAVHEYPDIEIVLVGDETQIKEILCDKGELDNPRITVQHASEVIGMNEHPGIALKRKKDASVVVATRLVHEKLCDAVVAPGSTGAAVGAALFGLGRIKGVDRPTIATPIPTLHGTTVMLDSGANANSKPKHMVQGAIMGYHYARLILGIENPTVGLLNIGEEASKGNELVLETLPLLQELKSIPFIGNVEGRDIPKGTVDVVVCDGFVGNVVLKFAEGLASVIMELLKDAILNGGWLAKLGALAIKPALGKLKRKLDHTEYGGAPLLGVNGSFIICHGSSKAKEIKSAIRVASEIVERNVIEHIHKSIEEEGVDKNGYN